MPIELKNAYYIKLGAGGRWADDSITNGLLRIGWSGIPLPDIHEKRWERIRERLAEEHSNKGTVTSDLGRLQDIAASTPEDIWITFHKSYLWWARLDSGLIEEDSISKFRRVQDSWRNTDQHGQPLLANQIPGRISQLQGFRGTACSVRESAALARLIAGEPSPEYVAASQARRALIEQVTKAVQQLHWKDFETLVDLVFRQAGWTRKSVLGETMKFADLELEEPITGDQYQVQIKSTADVKDLVNYAEQFSAGTFRRLYFVVHSPTPRLRHAASPHEKVEVVLPERLSEFVVDGGLVNWLLTKIR